MGNTPRPGSIPCVLSQSRASPRSIMTYSTSSLFMKTSYHLEQSAENRLLQSSSQRPGAYTT